MCLIRKGKRLVTLKEIHFFFHYVIVQPGPFFTLNLWSWPISGLSQFFLTVLLSPSMYTIFDPLGYDVILLYVVSEILITNLSRDNNKSKQLSRNYRQLEITFSDLNSWFHSLGFLEVVLYKRFLVGCTRRRYT